MNSYEAFRNALGLLSTEQRRKYLGLIVLQFLTSLLDLIALVAMGILTIATTTRNSNQESQGITNEILSFLRGQFTSEAYVFIFIAAVAGTLFISKSLLSLYFSRMALLFLSERAVEVSQNCFEDLVQKPLVFSQRRSSQDLAMSLTGGVSSSMLSILGLVSTLANEFGLLIILGITLFVIDPTLTLFTLVYFSIILFVLQQFLSGKGVRSGRERSLSDIQSFSLIQETVSSFREIYVANRFEFTTTKFSEIRNRSAKSVADAQWVVLVPKYAIECALIFGAGILGVYQYTRNDPSVAIGTSVIFLVSGFRILPSILRIQSAVSGIHNNVGPSEYFFRLLRELKAESVHSEAVESNPSDNLTKFQGSVSLQKVDFSYPNSHSMALSKIDLEITAGSSVAIVGESGAGKSTLVDLILGLHRPQSGTVNISGTTPSQAINMWPGKIGYVPQVTSLFNSTVRDNVAIGRAQSDIDDNRVWEALHISQLSQFISQHPEGLGMHVGERGVKLSGGQKQRLGLARALYDRPELLILDEATSSLDAETEDAISVALYDLLKNTTRITIAHRLATVRGADKVIFMEKGHIIASGTFSEVRAAVPQFDYQAKLLGL